LQQHAAANDEGIHTLFGWKSRNFTECLLFPSDIPLREQCVADETCA
jgi:hypothetical protein